MSEDPKHGATTIHASKGGGGSKWLLGAAAAVVLLGGGYFAWKSMTPAENSTQTAYNDQYSSDPLHAGPLPSDEGTLAQSASDESAPASTTTTTTRSTTTTRRASARAEAVPEETIGITPVNATTDDTDEVIVTAPRRPVWASTPSARRLTALYPQRALEHGREGEARLHCTVQNSGALDCVRAEETSGTFGNAALRVARTFRHAPQLADGRDAAGSPVNLRVVFRIDDEQRRG